MSRVTKFWRAIVSTVCKDDQKRTIILLILLINIFKGLLFSIITPLWEAPDEPFYFTYTKILVEELRIPTPDETSAAGHPFLYPLISSVPYLLGMLGGKTAQVFLMRFFGVLLSTLVVWLAFKIAETLFPQNVFIQFLAPILVAFNPQYSFISASVNSDALLVFFFSLLLYLLVKIIASSLSWSYLLWLTIVMGMGLLTKERFSLSFFPFSVTLLYELIKGIRSRLLLSLRNSILLPLLFIGVFSFIIIKSKSVVAALTTINTKFLYPLETRLLSVPAIPRSWSSLKYLLFHPSYSRSFAQRMFEEFWGFFGWLQIPLSPSVYEVLKIFCLATLLGLLIGIGRKAISQIRKIKTQQEEQIVFRKISTAQQSVVLLTFLITILITFYAIAIYDITTGPLGRGGGQGRYLFPVIIPLSILMSIGIKELFPQRTHKLLCVLLFLGFFVLNLASLFYFIVPFYYQGPSLL